MEQTSVVVIGAGIAGLLAANTLRQQGHAVIVLDKGSQVGGRMATRREGTAVWDHGAQFFTTRNAAFRDLVQGWEKEGVASLWCLGFPEVGNPIRFDGHARYRGTTGMNAIPKYLAQSLDVRLEQTVTEVSHHDGEWQVSTESGSVLQARGVILTPPVPQALALLDRGHVLLPESDRMALAAITYNPCIALLVELARPGTIPDPGAIRLGGEPLYWLADNSRKGISPLTPTATLHAGPEYSKSRWDAVDTSIVKELLDAAMPWIQPRQDRFLIKRWRYSQPVQTHPTSCFWVAALPGLVLAGDAFAGPRVEGAALSGLAAARQLDQVLAG
jgi:predicted NAD/FAD-dependent oxidoreductase